MEQIIATVVPTSKDSKKVKYLDQQARLKKGQSLELENAVEAVFGGIQPHRIMFNTQGYDMDENWWLGGFADTRLCSHPKTIQDFIVRSRDPLFKDESGTYLGSAVTVSVAEMFLQAQNERVTWVFGDKEIFAEQGMKEVDSGWSITGVPYWCSDNFPASEKTGKIVFVDKEMLEKHFVAVGYGVDVAGRLDAYRTIDIGPKDKPLQCIHADTLLVTMKKGTFVLEAMLDPSSTSRMETIGSFRSQPQTQFEETELKGRVLSPITRRLRFKSAEDMMLMIK